MTEKYITAPKLDAEERGTFGSLVADGIEDTLRNEGHEYVSPTQLKFWQNFCLKNGRSIDLSLPPAEDDVNLFGPSPSAPGTQYGLGPLEGINEGSAPLTPEPRPQPR